MIRPWYRSRLFWLGIPGLLFLLWLWLGVPTIPPEVRLYRNSETKLWQGRYEAGRVSLSIWTIRDPGIIFGRPGYGFQSSRDFRVPGDIVAPAIEWGSDVDPMDGVLRQSVLKLSVWLILVAYGVFWLGTLAWWKRRKSRLLKLHAPPPP